MKNLKHIFKKAAAALITAALCFGIACPVRAASLQATTALLTSFDLTKTIHANENLSLPNTLRFKYTATSDDPVDAPALTIVEDTFGPKNFTATSPLNSVKTHTAATKVNLPNYLHAGIYSYTIKETASALSDPYQLINNTVTNYTIKVAVINDSSSSTGLKITEVAISSSENPGAKADALTFDAKLIKYGKPGPEPDPQTNNEALVIKKIVAGDLGDQTKGFDFTLTFTETEGTEATLTSYPITVTGAEILKNGTSLAANLDGTYTLDLNTDYTFKLKHQDSLTLSGLPIGTKFTVFETAVTPYQTTAKKGAVTYNNKDVVTMVEGADQNTVEYTNTYHGIPLTGLFIDNLPFILLIILGIVVAAVTIISRRRRYQG